MLERRKALNSYSSLKAPYSYCQGFAYASGDWLPSLSDKAPKVGVQQDKRPADASAAHPSRIVHNAIISSQAGESRFPSKKAG